MPLYRRLPKRGFRAAAPEGVRGGQSRHAAEGDRRRSKLDAAKPIDAAAMQAAGLFKKASDGVRLLGKGEIKTKIEVKVAGASASAIAAVEKAGGKVELPPKPASRGGLNPRQRRPLTGRRVRGGSMASAAEQLASNLNWGAIGKATELKKRLWFTVGALVVFRIGAYIPVPGRRSRRPGRDVPAAGRRHRRHARRVLRRLDRPHVGAWRSSIMPYISASIIMQILTTVVPSLEALKKEGEAGRKKINQYTRYGTVILAAFQAYGIAVGLESHDRLDGPRRARSRRVLPLRHRRHPGGRHAAS